MEMENRDRKRRNKTKNFSLPWILFEANNMEMRALQNQSLFFGLRFINTNISVLNLAWKKINTPPVFNIRCIHRANLRFAQLHFSE